MLKAELRFLPNLPGATWLLTLAQAINLTCAVIAVTIAALIGSKLATTPALGTIPYGIQFASVMLCTYPASMLMRRFGRRVIFMIAALFLILSGTIGFFSVQSGSFGGLIVTHTLLGIYIACANFYRFAAVDNLATNIKAKAISLVVAGGVLAAIVGPLIASTLRSVIGFEDFALCYASFCILGILTLCLMIAWKPGSIPVEAVKQSPAKGTASGWSSTIIVAIFCSAGGYFMMNLLMVQASLVMKDFCSFGDSSRAIQVHVLAMFVPSFFTGSLISKIGLRQTLVLGFLLLCGATVYGLMAVRYDFIFIGLILLGLGWNFVYVGGGTLLAQSVDEESRHRWQGINDTVIAACATMGAFLPAPMLAGLGWNGSNLAVMPLCMIGIFLCFKILKGGMNGKEQPLSIKPNK
jgi:MFS family permease